MSPGWFDDVARFADVLEATQQDLLHTLRLKRQALVTGTPGDLQRLNEASLDAARRLKMLSVWRSQLLDQAHEAGSAGPTLSDVLAEWIDPWSERLRARFTAVQQRFGEAQRESWIQWIIAQRTEACYTDVLDLLAHGGQRPPTYGENAQSNSGVGGAVLDAAV
jgi:hypothetical protein